MISPFFINPTFLINSIIEQTGTELALGFVCEVTSIYRMGLYLRNKGSYCFHQDYRGAWKTQQGQLTHVSSII